MTSERRNNVIQIRVSDEEKELIATKAGERGITLSEWVRSSALVPVTAALEAALGGQEPRDTASVSSPRQSGTLEKAAPTEHPVSPRAPTDSETGRAPDGQSP